MAEEQQESLVKRRERAWYLRREVGFTARQDVYAAYFAQLKRQEQVKEAQNTINALVHYPLPTE